MNEIFINGKKLRYCIEKNNNLFYVKDICSLIDVKNASLTARNIDINEKKYKYIDTNGGMQKVIMVTENGLFNMINRSSKLSYINKKSIIDNLKSNFLLNNISLYSRKEADFFEIISDVFKPIKLDVFYQYKVGKYYIDFYIPKINIAIEYDENNHSNYDKILESERELFLEKELKCRLIRISDNNTHFYNIGIIFAHLTKLVICDSIF